MPAETRLHEHTFNVLLADALKVTSVRWQQSGVVEAERRGALQKPGLRPDIIVNDPVAPKVVVECAYGGDNDKDALRRLEAHSFDTAFSVAIPERFQTMKNNAVRRALKEKDALAYALLQRDGGGDIRRFPKSGYITGSAIDLADMIRTASVPRSQLERTAEKVADLINEAANVLMKGLADADRRHIADSVYQNTHLTAGRTVAILWLDAMLVQSHLRVFVPEDVDVLPLMEVKPTDLASAWRKILARNWHSIFEPAVDVLERAASRARRPTAGALRHLLAAVEEIETARLGDHINIGAELFPKISEDRKTAAAFYTTPATAEFLTALLVLERDRNDWDDPLLFRDLRVGDLACGTGSLLRAVYRRVRAFNELRVNDGAVFTGLHRAAMEDGIVAADISPIAVHLTNSSMALMGSGRPYNHTSISWVSVGQPLGGPNGGRSTGSLELLKTGALTDLFATLGSRAGGVGTIENPLNVANESLDYVIMNPPYSRTRGGQRSFDVAGLDAATRKSCQKRWGRLLHNQPAVKTAGMAASFLCLARAKVKRGGRIGFVLPLTAAFAESWRVTREMIVHDFEDIIAVTAASQLGSVDALSADTHMGEMLLVAKRRPEKGSPSPVRCVTLQRLPFRAGEACEYARCVQRILDEMTVDSHPVFAGGEELGQIATFRPEGGEAWSHLGVLHADLAVAATGIATSGQLSGVQDLGGAVFACPMTTIGNLFEVGPTHHLIGHTAGKEPIGALTLYPITRRADARGSNRVLWKADAKKQTQLRVVPTHKGIVYDQAKMGSIRSGRLHYARGMRWTSQALLAATTQDNVFGGRAWTSLIHHDRRILWAFALWANSTLGLITHWTQGSRTHLGRATTQVQAIHAMPCPNLAALGDDTLDAAAEAFKKLSSDSLLPACQAHVDPVRAMIDEAVLTMLGLPVESGAVRFRQQQVNCKVAAGDNAAAIVACQQWWCAEPTVHGNNNAALELLRTAGLEE